MGLKVTNNAFGTLNAGINSSATTIVLTAGQGARFPTLSAGDYFYATLIDTSNNLEIVKVTARSTDTMTVVRGQDNTTARAYSTNDRFELRPTAALFNEKANANEYLPLAGGTLTGKLAIGAGVTPVTALHAQSSANEADRSLRLAYDGTYFSEIRQLGAAGMAFRNNNTDNQMLIDGAGRVTMQYQPAFLVRLSSSNVVGAGIVLYNSVDSNIGGHYNTSNGRFTAPVTGHYAFNVTMTGASGVTNISMEIERNGVSMAQIGWQNGTVAPGQELSSGNGIVIRLTAGDYITIRAGHSIRGDIAKINAFSGTLLG